MKILIVRTFPDIINPHQYNVQEIGLAKALVRRGYECGIVLYNGKNKDEIEDIPVSCEGETRNIKLYKLHGFSVLKNGFFPSLNKIVKQYDVIQVHEYDQITSWLYYAWSKKPVVIYHGPYYHEFNKGYNFKCKIFDNLFLRLKHNRNIPCLTKSIAAYEFLKSKGFNNVIPVGVGLDIDNFVYEDLDEDKKIKINTEKFTLLYVGKIEERRNSFFLADVIEMITKQYEDINFIIIGNGEKSYTTKFLDRIDGMLKKGIGIYYSCATQAQLADLYQRASAMLFPSNYEIFGMVLLEAAYFGLPIISSQNGGADMLLREGEKGVIVEEFRENLWLAEIEKCYKRWKGGDKKKFNSAKFNKEELLWDNVCKSMIEVYERLEKRKC